MTGPSEGRVCMTKNCPAEGLWTRKPICPGCGKSTVNFRDATEKAEGEGQ